MTLGERLRQARLAHSMSLAALARASGLSKGFLSQVESGATNPSLGSLRRLAEALSLSVSDLMSSGPIRPAASGTSRPRLVRRVLPERDRTFLKQIGSSSLGVAYMVHLLPGSALETIAPTNGGDAYLIVLAGEMQFHQPGTSLGLAEGDSLTFSLSQQYRLTAQPRLRASLLLMLPTTHDLPRVVETPLREVVRTPYEGALRPAEFRGPLRLVAMRAARAAERER